MNIDVPKTGKLKGFFGIFFQGLGIAASVFAFIKLDTLVPEDSAGIIYASFVIAVTLALAAYIYLLHSRKLHRYADIPPFIHFVNHTIRNILTRTRQKVAVGQLTNEDIEEIELATIAMLDAVAHCFSIITGAQCGVCIKEIQHGDQPLLRTVYRDSISQQTRGADDAEQTPHDIEEDTPCWKTFAGESGCERGYSCNDVKDEWLRGRYRSASFQRYGGPPNCLSLLGLKMIRNWHLHYSSTFVSPIRYRSFSKNGGRVPRPGRPYPPGVRYWGFLCVDAKKRNLFFENRHRDVLAAFSDALFVYFNEIHDIVDRYTKPSA